QLDRVPGYELGGREFESLRARHSAKGRRFIPSAFSFLAGGNASFALTRAQTPPYHGRLQPRMSAVLHRGIAQSGRAPALGAGCRGFESLCPDHCSRDRPRSPLRFGAWQEFILSRFVESGFTLLRKPS